MERIGNAVFGGLWCLYGGAILIACLRDRKAPRATWVVGLSLALFGVSDFVEIWSGAWWRPWWLLAWKVCCLIGGPIAISVLSRGTPDDEDSLRDESRITGKE